MRDALRKALSSPERFDAYCDQHGFQHRFVIAQPANPSSGDVDFAARLMWRTFLAENGLREEADIIYKSFRAETGERLIRVALRDLSAATLVRVAFGSIDEQGN